MIPEPSVDISQMFKYLWVVYILFVAVAAGATWVLFYHWSKYAQIHTAGLRTMQAVYIVVLVFLVMLATGFFIAI